MTTATQLAFTGEGNAIAWRVPSGETSGRSTAKTDPSTTIESFFGARATATSGGGFTESSSPLKLTPEGAENDAKACLPAPGSSSTQAVASSPSTASDAEPLDALFARSTRKEDGAPVAAVAASFVAPARREPMGS